MDLFSLKNAFHTESRKPNSKSIMDALIAHHRKGLPKSLKVLKTLKEEEDWNHLDIMKSLVKLCISIIQEKEIEEVRHCYDEAKSLLETNVEVLDDITDQIAEVNYLNEMECLKEYFDTLECMWDDYAYAFCEEIDKD